MRLFFFYRLQKDGLTIVLQNKAQAHTHRHTHTDTHAHVHETCLKMGRLTLKYDFFSVGKPRDPRCVNSPLTTIAVIVSYFPIVFC